MVEDGDIIFFKFNAGAGLKDAKKKWRDKVLLILVHMLYLNLALYTILHVAWITDIFHNKLLYRMGQKVMYISKIH